MSSSRPGRLHLGSSLDGLEVAVRDSTFREVARAFGAVDIELPAGLYEVELRIGPTRETQLVKLEPGGLHEDTDLRIALPSAAPVQGTSTSHEFHQEPVAAASRALAASGSAAGLIVMVRNLRGDEKLRFREDTAAALSILDADGQRVGGDRWRFDGDRLFAILAEPLPPGGYALRSGRGDAALESSIWLEAGWQTLVFVPNTREGPAPAHASVHMTRRAKPWAAWDESGGRLGLALEAALWGLREGHAVVPRDLMNLLLRSKFGNPMLGIVGAHALLLESEPNLRLVDTVLGNLAKLVPDHPDVAALRWLAQEARARQTGKGPNAARFKGSVSWPPVLLASYDALIRLDAHKPGVIAADSAAERAAGQLVVTGVWSSWAPLGSPRAGRRFRTRGAEGVDPGRDPATARVETYLRGAAELRDIEMEEMLEMTQPQGLALATGLPTASVRRALDELGGGLVTS